MLVGLSDSWKLCCSVPFGALAERKGDDISLKLLDAIKRELALADPQADAEQALPTFDSNAAATDSAAAAPMVLDSELPVKGEPSLDSDDDKIGRAHV